jgi:hypothetical protein
VIPSHFLIFQIFFLGWPKVKVLAKPVNEILPAILLALNSFLLPIVISCAIYLKLIFIKGKLFFNKISTFQKTIEQQNNTNFSKKTQLIQLNDLQVASSLISSNIQEACIVVHAEENALISSIRCAISNSKMQNSHKLDFLNSTITLLNSNF